jgi:hypothetical protein
LVPTVTVRADSGDIVTAFATKRYNYATVAIITLSVVTLSIATGSTAYPASSPVLRTTGLTTSAFYAPSLSELNYARDGNLDLIAA